MPGLERMNVLYKYIETVECFMSITCVKDFSDLLVAF